MNKKKNPRTQFIIIRVTPMEKQKLVEDAVEDNLGFSVSVRSKLGLKTNE